MDDKALRELLDTISRCGDVRRTADPETASSIAYCIDALDGHCREFIDRQLPALRAADPASACELLTEIGATFGQMVWHIRLASFFRAYIQEPD